MIYLATVRRDELFPFFKQLSEAGRTEFSALRTAQAAPRVQLLERGDCASGAYFVLSGTLRVYYVTDEGREATLYTVAAGDTCVLALSSTLQKQTYPAWVEAGAGGGSFLCLASPAFHRLLDAEPAFRAFVLNAMSSRIFELMSTLEQVATSTIIRRVADYLVHNAAHDGEVLVTQTRLATELGTAREVVFRALRVLTARGLISARRGRVRLLDVQGLVRAANGAH